MTTDNGHCTTDHTSAVSKIIEKLIRMGWVGHLEKCEMLSERKFEFRKGKSWVSNLLCYYK